MLIRWSHVVAVGLLPLLSLAAPERTPSVRPLYKNPLDVTVDEKGQTARVVLTGTRTVAVVDLATGRIKEETAWPELRTMPQPADVAWHLPDTMIAIRAALGSRVRENTKDITNVRAISANPSGASDHLVIACQRPRTNIPATQVSQGWVFVNALRFLDYSLARKQLTFSLDSPNRGMSDPSDVLRSPDSMFVCIASAGTDTVMLLDLPRLEKAVWVGGYVQFAPRDGQEYALSSQYVLARLPTQSNPRRLGLSGDGKTLVVSNYLSDSLTVIDTEKLKVVKHIALGGPEPDAARRGEMLFNSARLTQFGQFTCASCHPNGGADGLNWDLPRDGIGNFKNTKSLLGVKDTAPYGWLGTSATLADRVAGTLRTLHRYEPSEDEVNDIVAYLETLPAPAPPSRSGLRQEDIGAIERGQALFAGKARCDGCHSGPAFDDGKIHDVGTGTIPAEERINTPSLRGLASTAPYLHDGRAATLDEVFSKYNAKKKHGDADRLTAEELADLVAYLRSL